MRRQTPPASSPTGEVRPAAQRVAFDVRAFGASGVARPIGQVRVAQARFGFLRLPAGKTFPVYGLPPGASLDSLGIQAAIDAAHKAGGGVVHVPAGDYLIKPIELRSRVTLHLAPGARLWASPELVDYLSDGPVLEGSVDRSPSRIDVELSGYGKRRLISAADAEDVSITGFGEVHAQSPAWVVPWLNTHPDAWLKQRPTDTLYFYRCRRVRIEGIRIVNTPAWTLVFDTCDDVAVRGLAIDGIDMMNSDGIDLVNTSNATLADCRIHCADDAICLKNMTPDATMSSVTVSNCIIRTLCNALKVGTETTGNFENIAFSNIVIRNTPDDPQGAEGGINLCAVDGGQVRNVSYSNIVMQNVQCPFYFVAHQRERNQIAYRTPRPGKISGVMLHQVRADGCRCPAWIVGHPDAPIRDVSLANVRIHKTGGTYRDPPPPFDGRFHYPTPDMFGRVGFDDLPASGLYLRHAEHVRTQQIDVTSTEDDVRPWFKADHCSDFGGPTAEVSP